MSLRLTAVLSPSYDTLYFQRSGHETLLQCRGQTACLVAHGQKICIPSLVTFCSDTVYPHYVTKGQKVIRHRLVDAKSPFIDV